MKEKFARFIIISYYDYKIDKYYFEYLYRIKTFTIWKENILLYLYFKRSFKSLISDNTFKLVFFLNDIIYKI
jgi:hypothetical protein